MPELRRAGAVCWLGEVAYREAWALQRGLAEARRQERMPDTLLMVEHPHVYTLGRRGSPVHILADPARLRQRGVDVVPIDRGGGITYHGPGQLVVYPILHLDRWGGDVVHYVRMLEAVAIRAVASFGVTAERRPGMTGVWVGDRKLVAIGVRVSRWVTTHGLAINVDPDMSYFADIIPCGLHGYGAASLAELLGAAPAVAGVRAAVHQAFEAVFDLPLQEESVVTVRGWAIAAPPEPAPSPLQLGQSAA